MKHLKPTLLALSACCAAQAADCDYEKMIEFSLAQDAIERIVIDAGAGALEVNGDEGQEITVVAQVCASDEGRLENSYVEQSRSGRDLRLTTEIPDSDGGWFGKDGYARINLRIMMPRALDLDIDDGSGSIAVDGAGAVRVEDGSGSIDIANATGRVTINDGSGSITLRAVGGEVAIDDGSGSIEIDEVKRTVHIVDDGSGSIRINHVDGDVVIDEDGSGSIRIADVGGSVRVDRDGSGSINVQRVNGDFDVGRAGSGGIHHAQVLGQVRLPDRY